MHPRFVIVVLDNVNTERNAGGARAGFGQIEEGDQPADLNAVGTITRVEKLEPFTDAIWKRLNSLNSGNSRLGAGYQK